MKSYFKMLFSCVPLAFGIVLSLLSIAFTVKVMEGSSGDDVAAALFLGLLGYPLAITSTVKLTEKLTKEAS